MKKSQAENSDSSGISNKQAVLYLGVVIVCFATLYPRVIHPMVSSALGLGENVNEKAKGEQGKSF